MARLNAKISQSHSDELQQDSSDEASQHEDDANYYKENIFNKEDFYLYRGVLNLFGGSYD